MFECVSLDSGFKLQHAAGENVFHSTKQFKTNIVEFLFRHVSMPFNWAGIDLYVVSLRIKTHQVKKSLNSPNESSHHEYIYHVFESLAYCYCNLCLDRTIQFSMFADLLSFRR